MCSSANQSRASVIFFTQVQFQCCDLPWEVLQIPPFYWIMWYVLDKRQIFSNVITSVLVQLAVINHMKLVFNVKVCKLTK